MGIALGINGFGRIGRLVFRRSFEIEGIDVVAINDLIELDYIAYMLRYDSTHGRFRGEVETRDGQLIVNGKAIRVTSERDPAALNWGAWAPMWCSNQPACSSPTLRRGPTSRRAPRRWCSQPLPRTTRRCS